MKSRAWRASGALLNAAADNPDFQAGLAWAWAGEAGCPGAAGACRNTQRGGPLAAAVRSLRYQPAAPARLVRVPSRTRPAVIPLSPCGRESKPALTTPFVPPPQISTLQATRSKAGAAVAAARGASSPSEEGTTTTAAVALPGTTVPAPAGRTSSTIADLARIVSTHGWTGLYAGLRPALLGTALSQGVYFYLYQQLREAALGRAAASAAGVAALAAARRARAGLPALPPAAFAPPADLAPGAALLVASLAGAGNVLLTCPIWVVATRMQADRGGGAAAVAECATTGEGEGRASRAATAWRPTPLSTARELWAEGGLPAFWRGVAPSLIMVSNPTVTYFLYEWLLARAARRGRARALASARAGGGGKAAVGAALAAYRPGPGTVFAVSAASKLGATVVTYPILLVKARLQAAGAHTSADRVYTGTADAVQRIWSEGGLAGFYAGLRPKLVQSILAAALLMSIKEEVSAGVRRALVPRPARMVVMGPRGMTSPARA